MCDPRDTSSCIPQQTFLGPYCLGLSGHRQELDTALTEEMRKVQGLEVPLPVVGPGKEEVRAMGSGGSHKACRPDEAELGGVVTPRGAA